MKLANFIYPMFLVAIGLHGLLLFVPIGDAADADSVEEDIALSELPESAKGKLAPAADSLLVPLPVPDLNVAAGGAAAGGVAGSAIAKTPGGAASTATTSARTSAASAPTARAARTRTAARPAAARPATAPANATARTSASAGTTGQSTAAGATTSGSAAGSSGLSIADPSDDALPSFESANASSGSSISLARDVNASASSNEGTTANEPAISSLIASATGRVTDALKSLSSDFAADFTYTEEGTDTAGLEDRRKRWVENISQQANTDLSSGETVEPIELEAAELSYPIEESAQADRRAFRICLDDVVPNDAEVAVLFDSQGKVVADPEMTLSSGYPAIDKEILAMAAEAEGFPDDRESKAYLLAFDVEYVADSCVSLPKLKE
ncbi:MAG: hypothetical protein AAGC93_03855 [Cyanobacteria bacterium P01_F01_bin.53]